MRSERRILRRSVGPSTGRTDTIGDADPGEGMFPDDPYDGGRRPMPLFLKVFLVVSGSAIAVYAAWLMVGTDALYAIIAEYWPVLLSPLLGIVLGKMVARELYAPVGRLLVQLDVDHHMFRAVFVPERMFRYLEQTGNNVVYHTPSGVPVYLVEGMDLASGRVDYGWVHEADPMIVMTREETYRKWYATLNETMAENLQLIANPKVIGLGYARKTLRDHLNRIAEAVGLDVPDYEYHSTFDEGPDTEGGQNDPEASGGRGIPNGPFGDDRGGVRRER